MQEMLAEERSNAAVARQIYELRTAKGLTQQELAELIGTKQPVIARLEDADYEGTRSQCCTVSAPHSAAVWPWDLCRGRWGREGRHSRRQCARPRDARG